MLAHLTGPENVTSVEVDAAMAGHARASLAAAGYPVCVITGDGEQGCSENAPYDRVIATAAVHTLPPAWVGQTRPYGRIVVPWVPTFHPDGPLAVISVGEDGTANGRFLEPAHFMPLRSQRLAPQDSHEVRERWESDGKPDCARFGITVTSGHQRIWRDHPDNHVDLPVGAG